MGPEPVLLPLDKELQERLHWLTGLRWIAGFAILGGIGVGPRLLGIPLPAVPLLGVALTLLSYNLVLHLKRQWISATPARVRNVAHLQIGLDWAALTATVCLTGGIASPVCLAYAFHLIIGAILLSRPVCYLLACGVGVILGTLAWLAPADSFRTWAVLTLFFFVTTYLATSITARLRQKEDALSRMTQALDRSFQEMESLYNIGQLVNSTLDLHEVLRLLAEHTTRLFGAKAGFVRIFDREGKTLSMGGSYGLSREYLDKGPVEVGKSWVDFEVLKGRMVQMEDVTKDLRFQYREEARREGLRSMLSCPMRAKDRTLGVIRIYTSEPRVFSGQEEKLLLNLANLGALALQNARSFGDLQAVDKERIWFARTTHHQLRSPLAAAQGAIDALSYAGTAERRAEGPRRARREADPGFLRHHPGPPRLGRGAAGSRGGNDGPRPAGRCAPANHGHGAGAGPVQGVVYRRGDGGGRIASCGRTRATWRRSSRTS